MARGQNVAVSAPRNFAIEREIRGILNESTNPARIQPGDLTILQNYVYRQYGGVAKRTGSGPYGGAGSIGTGTPVQSAFRWHAAVPNVVDELLAQSNNKIFLGNDSNGTFSQIGTLASNSTPAFFCGAYDPAESGVGGTPASDICIIAYGSGQPKKWDGTNFTNLSSAITNHFAGCAAWHNHVFFWGDPNNPYTVFATDINNPESYTFSTNFGGYQIGVGDGDPVVQCCIPVGNVLFIFKTRSIWAMTGFDFYQGNYQFNLTPVTQDNGTTAPFSVRELNGAVIFWNGSVFKVLNPDWSITTLSQPIEMEAGMTASGTQTLLRAAAGSYEVTYGSESIVYEDIYVCAVPDSTGTASTVLMYDDVQTKIVGRPAWSVIKGWSVGCWFERLGINDIRTLFWGDCTIDQCNQVGQNGISDSGNSIATIIQFPQDAMTDASSPVWGSADKWLEYVYVQLTSGAASFTITVYSATGLKTVTLAIAAAAPAQGGIWGTGLWGTMLWGAAVGQIFQSLIGKVDPWLRGKNFTVSIAEQSATSSYEMLGLGYQGTVEALPR